MKRKISLKMWLSVFFGGIRQFVCNIFSWKKDSVLACYLACYYRLYRCLHMHAGILFSSRILLR